MTQGWVAGKAASDSIRSPSVAYVGRSLHYNSFYFIITGKKGFDIKLEFQTNFRSVHG